MGHGCGLEDVGCWNYVVCASCNHRQTDGISGGGLIVNIVLSLPFITYGVMNLYIAWLCFVDRRVTFTGE